MINKHNGFTIRGLLLILLGIIPMIYQVVNSFNLNSNFIYLGFILINILLLFKMKNNLYFSKKILLISGVFFIAYVILPMVFNTVTNVDWKISLLYMGLFVLFISSLTIITVFFDKSDRVHILRSSLVGNSLFLLYAIISNVNQITPRTVLSVINGSRAYRADFSFGHPNTAAMFIFIEIVLIYLLFIINDDNKIYGIILMIVFIVPMLATGSRTALYALLLFYILEIFRKLNFKISTKNKILMYYILIIPMGILFYLNFSLTDFLDSSSGRNESVMYNFRFIKDSGRLITGFGPTPITSIKYLLPSVAITDTWYVTHIISFGIVSLVLIGINIIHIFVHFIQNENKTNSVILSLIIVLLFYSGAENVLFIPGTIISWIFWMMIYMELKFI